MSANEISPVDQHVKTPVLRDAVHLGLKSQQFLEETDRFGSWEKVYDSQIRARLFADHNLDDRLLDLFFSAKASSSTPESTPESFSGITTDMFAKVFSAFAGVGQREITKPDMDSCYKKWSTAEGMDYQSFMSAIDELLAQAHEISVRDL